MGHFRIVIVDRDHRLAQDNFEFFQKNSFCVATCILHFIDGSLSTSSDLPNDAPAPAIYPRISISHWPILPDYCGRRDGGPEARLR